MKTLTQKALWADDYEPCDGYWSDLYEDMCNRQNARAIGCTVDQLCFCGYKAKDPDLGDGSRCEECHDRHTEYLATRQAISDLEGADPKVNWDEYQEEEEDTSCPQCGAWSCASVLCDKCYSEEDEEAPNQVTLEQIEKDAYYADLEEEKKAFWYQDIENALSVSRKTFIPKFSKRKTCFGKDRRENGRRLKYQWKNC